MRAKQRPDTAVATLGSVIAKPNMPICFIWSMKASG